MRRRELIAGVGSVGVLAGATGIVLGGVPSFGTDRAASEAGGETDGRIEVETINARGSEAGTMTVPNDDVTVAMFLVTGCGKCQAHLPRLADARSRLVEDYGDDLTFLSVTYQSFDSMPADELRDWWRAHSGNWTVGYDSNATLAANYGIVGYPVTAVVDDQGEKRWETLGVTPAEDIVAAVESVLESSDRETASAAENETSEASAGD
ncbi:TlpA family protein disulfide reductase [Natrinema versiforme]|uniref:Alkyl hydroperoxide reductase/ Thiol specific antioxidant/ Mal allergen n=1 Tax=Natrinema versiforme JCM 10478 TaxID=1227496 RepID=L9YBE1_9EURY|nr:TlpA disulfide reductase family protein [Natrinema versiforme]ELY70238.1 alkyl hydroperoxide reductase/ Thiol specific antioxidant/ Mal allergen [Natrinema versiforme JCM 10478]